jgi:hypothetical protein
MVERFHRQLKDALRAQLVNQDWLSQLPWVLLRLGASPKEDCGLSSAEMVFGEPLVLPGQFFNSSPPAAGFLEQLRQNMERFVPPAVRPVTTVEPYRPKLLRLIYRRPLLCTSREHHLQASLPCTRGPTRSC